VVLRRSDLDTISEEASSLEESWKMRGKIWIGLASLISPHSNESLLPNIFSVALVPVKLLLEAGLGILDAYQCAQRSLECFGANRTGSDRRNASEILNDTKSAFCHVFQTPKRQQLRSARAFKYFPTACVG